MKRVLLCGLIMAGVVVTATASAAPTPAEEKEISNLIDKGTDLFEARKFAEAREQFAEAYRRVHSPVLRQNLALAEQESKHSAEAAGHFCENLSDPKSDAAVVQVSRAQLKKLDDFVGYIELIDTAGMLVYLDDSPLPINYGPRICVTPGTHVLRAAGQNTVTVSAPAGKTVRATFTALPVPQAAEHTAAASAPDETTLKASPPPPRVDATTSPEDKTSKTWAKIALGAGIATVVTGGVFLAARVEMHDETNTGWNIHNSLAAGACPGASACQSLANAAHSHDTWKTTSDVLGVGTIALAAGTGVAMYMWLRPSDQERPRDAVLTPMVGPGLAGLHLSGSF